MKHYRSSVVVHSLALVFALLLVAGTAHGQPFSDKGRLKAGIAQRAKLLAKDHPRFRAAMEARQRHALKLMDVQGVVGTGVGIGPEGEPILRVFTSRAGVRGIPEILEGIPVRTSVTGRFYALADTTARFERPVPIGVSTGHPAITAGTIGARVRDIKGNVYALSNNHVYANVNSANLGDPVLQPGSFDGGSMGSNPYLIDGDEIGTLDAYVPMSFCTIWWIWLICPEVNTVDAAIARCTPDTLGTDTLTDGYGTPSETIFNDSNGDGFFDNKTSLLGLKVKKYGRTTGMTYGEISAIDATVNVCYDDACSLIARFEDQLIISPGTFSGGGDSGSLIVTDDDANQPVALLFAGSDTETIANRIDLVLNSFGVTVDGGPVEPFVDVAVTSVDAPTTVVEDSDDGVDVSVTVQNLGNRDVDPFQVTLSVKDPVNLEVHSESKAVPVLSPGSSEVFPFHWDTKLAPLGTYTLEAAHSLADGDDTNDSASASIEVVLSIKDVAITAINVPATVEEGSPVPVGVTVKNVGNVMVGTFNVTLCDSTKGSEIGTQPVYGLAVNEASTVSFEWNVLGSGDHELVASHDLGDGETYNDVQYVAVNVIAPSAGPNLRFGQVWASTAEWTTVTLDHDYDTDMVVVCTVNYDDDPYGYAVTPLVAVVQNAYDDAFDVKLSPAVWTTFETSEAWVHWVVVERGVYTMEEHGVKMEAAKFLSTVTDKKRSWVGQSRSYSQTYSNPVVVGQVMTYSSGLWTAFWCRGTSSTNPPSAGSLWVGKHMGEDRRTRANEIIGYIVIEAGSGLINGNPYVANLGPDSISGVGNSPPYAYSVSGISASSTAIVSQAGMDGGDGGWAILYGDNPVSPDALNLAIDEDWAIDSERNHSTEQVGYIVLEQ